MQQRVGAVLTVQQPVSEATVDGLTVLLQEAQEAGVAAALCAQLANLLQLVRQRDEAADRCTALLSRPITELTAAALDQLLVEARRCSVGAALIQRCTETLELVGRRDALQEQMQAARGTPFDQLHSMTVRDLLSAETAGSVAADVREACEALLARLERRDAVQQRVEAVMRDADQMWKQVALDMHILRDEAREARVDPTTIAALERLIHGLERRDEQERRMETILAPEGGRALWELTKEFLRTLRAEAEILHVSPDIVSRCGEVLRLVNQRDDCRERLDEMMRQPCAELVNVLDDMSTGPCKLREDAESSGVPDNVLRSCDAMIADVRRCEAAQRELGVCKGRALAWETPAAGLANSVTLRSLEEATRHAIDAEVYPTDIEDAQTTIMYLRRRQAAEQELWEMVQGPEKEIDVNRFQELYDKAVEARVKNSELMDRAKELLKRLLRARRLLGPLIGMQPVPGSDELLDLLNHLIQFISNLRPLRPDPTDPTDPTDRVDIFEKAVQIISSSPITIKHVVDVIGGGGMTDPEKVDFVVNFATGFYNRHAKSSGFMLCANHKPGGPTWKQLQAQEVAVVTLQSFQEEVSTNTGTDISKLTDYRVGAGKPPKGQENDIEKAVIYGYTTNDFYNDIKNDFRSHGPEKWPITGATLASCIGKLPSPDIDHALYRGEKQLGRGKFIDMFQVGYVDVWDSFSSTSTNKAQAWNFSEGNIMFEVTGIPSAVCGHCDHISFFSTEEEVLVTAGCQFVVTEHLTDHLTDCGEVKHLIKLKYLSKMLHSNRLGFRCSDAVLTNACPGASDESSEMDVDETAGRPVPPSTMCAWCCLERCTDDLSCLDQARACELLTLTPFCRLLKTTNATGNRLNVNMPCINLHVKSGSTSSAGALSKMNQTLIYQAARNGQGDVVQKLLELGANPGLQLEPQRWNALHIACFYDQNRAVKATAYTEGRVECVRLILEKASTEEASKLKAFKDQAGDTPTDLAKNMLLLPGPQASKAATTEILRLLGCSAADGSALDVEQLERERQQRMREVMKEERVEEEARLRKKFGQSSSANYKSDEFERKKCIAQGMVDFSKARHERLRAEAQSLREKHEHEQQELKAAKDKIEGLGGAQLDESLAYAQLKELANKVKELGDDSPRLLVEIKVKDWAVSIALDELNAANADMQRVHRGAAIGKDFTVTLFWKKNCDLDLHVVCPGELPLLGFASWSTP